AVQNISAHESRVPYSSVTKIPIPAMSTSAAISRAPVPSMRLGFRYVKGLREEAAQAIVRERLKRPFCDIDDLHNRVPELRKDELRKLAEVGALNFIGGNTSRRSASVVKSPTLRNPQSLNRRSALWQVERASRAVGPLLKDQKDQNLNSPLK